MVVDEFYKKWGSWRKSAMKLGVSVQGMLYWRNRGSIPYKSQLLIEENTKGEFKADRKDDLKDGA